MWDWFRKKFPKIAASFSAIGEWVSEIFGGESLRNANRAAKAEYKRARDNNRSSNRVTEFMRYTGHGIVDGFNAAADEIGQAFENLVDRVDSAVDNAKDSNHQKTRFADVIKSAKTTVPIKIKYKVSALDFHLFNDSFTEVQYNARHESPPPLPTPQQLTECVQKIQTRKPIEKVVIIDHQKKEHVYRLDGKSKQFVLSEGQVLKKE